jgi:hypothetical protein
MSAGHRLDTVVERQLSVSPARRSREIGLFSCSAKRTESFFSYRATHCTPGGTYPTHVLLMLPLVVAGSVSRMAGLIKHNLFYQRNLKLSNRESLTAMRKALAVAAVTMGLAVRSVCAAQETVNHTFEGDGGSDGSFPTGGMGFDPIGSAHAAAPGSANGNWSEFGFVPSGGRFNPAEHVLNTTNVAALTVLWSTSDGSFPLTAPAVVDGVVYSGTSAFEAATGKLLWATNSFGISPAVSKATVYIDSFFGLCAYTRADGTNLWCAGTNYLPDAPSGAAVVDGIAYFGSAVGSVFAIDAATGEQIWSAPISATTRLPHRRWPMAWSISMVTIFSPSTRRPVHSFGLRRSWARSILPRRPWSEASFMPAAASLPRSMRLRAPCFGRYRPAVHFRYRGIRPPWRGAWFISAPQSRASMDHQAARSMRSTHVRAKRFGPRPWRAGSHPRLPSPMASSMSEAMTAPSMRSTQRLARSSRPSLVLLDSHRQQWRMEWSIRKRRSPVSFSRLASTRTKLAGPTRHKGNREGLRPRVFCDNCATRQHTAVAFGEIPKEIALALYPPRPEGVYTLKHLTKVLSGSHYELTQALDRTESFDRHTGRSPELHLFGAARRGTSPI